MVNSSLAPRRSARGIWQRMRWLIREPGDIPLTLQTGFFIWRIPNQLDQKPLPTLLQILQAGGRPSAPDLTASRERVNRLSRPWFQLPFFKSRNTCYLRSLMYFRFLDNQGKTMRIHFVVEPERTSAGRLRGHAWVSVGQEIIEPPPGDVVMTAKRIYTFPADE